MIVELTPSEMRFGASVGIERRLSALEHKRKDRYGKPKGDPWGIDITSSMAELAVAKATGAYWFAHVGSADTELPGDVGNLQVRSTGYATGCLVLHKADDDDAKFLLVIANAPRFKIAGWMFGKDGKKEKYWKTEWERPCYLVPQDDLTPIAVLK